MASSWGCERCGICEAAALTTEGLQEQHLVALILRYCLIVASFDQLESFPSVPQPAIQPLVLGYGENEFARQMLESWRIGVIALQDGRQVLRREKGLVHQYVGSGGRKQSR